MSRAKSFCLAVTLWLGAGLVASAPGAASTKPTEGTLRFDVVLDGRQIGEHALTFEAQPDGSLQVAIDIDLDITFGPFTVFAYTHRNRTAWRDGQLLALDSETDDDGERHWVRAISGDNGLTIQTDREAEIDVAPTLLPSTYWMVSTVRQTQLINSQTGELLDVDVRKIGRDYLDGPGGLIAATHYRLEGDLEIDLWYDDAGILVGLAFVARGAQVEYRLRERSGAIPVSMAGNIMTAQR